MSEHRATVEWRLSGEFRDETYSRAHALGALSACHMLWFLHLACRKKWGGEQYVDEAVGILDKTWMSRVTLRPRVTFSGPAPSAQEPC